MSYVIPSRRQLLAARTPSPAPRSRFRPRPFSETIPDMADSRNYVPPERRAPESPLEAVVRQVVDHHRGIDSTNSTEERPLSDRDAGALLRHLQQAAPGVLDGGATADGGDEPAPADTAPSMTAPTGAAAEDQPALDDEEPIDLGTLDDGDAPLAFSPAARGSAWRERILATLPSLPPPPALMPLPVRDLHGENQRALQGSLWAGLLGLVLGGPEAGLRMTLGAGQGVREGADRNWAQRVQTADQIRRGQVEQYARARQSWSDSMATLNARLRGASLQDQADLRRDQLTLSAREKAAQAAERKERLEQQKKRDETTATFRQQQLDAGKAKLELERDRANAPKVPTFSDLSRRRKEILESLSGTPEEVSTGQQAHAASEYNALLDQLGQKIPAARALRLPVPGTPLAADTKTGARRFEARFPLSPQKQRLALQRESADRRREEAAAHHREIERRISLAEKSQGHRFDTEQRRLVYERERIRLARWKASQGKSGNGFTAGEEARLKRLYQLDQNHSRDEEEALRLEASKRRSDHERAKVVRTRMQGNRRERQRLEGMGKKSGKVNADDFTIEVIPDGKGGKR